MQWPVLRSRLTSAVETLQIFWTGRGLTMSALVFDGFALVGFTAVIASGGSDMTTLEGFVASALLLGFLSALGSMLIAVPPPQRAEVTVPERRRLERRVVHITSPTGMERRSGVDRRMCDLSLDTILSPLPGRDSQRPSA